MHLQALLPEYNRGLDWRGLEENPTRNREVFYRLGKSLVDLYAGMMLELDIQWHAPLPNGPKILAANHPTTTDPLYLMTLLSESVSFLITAASFNFPALGQYLRAAGHIPAIRGSGGATVDALIGKIESGCSIAIFPEGALSPLNGDFQRPHSGVARVALKTGAPVIPIGIGVQRDRIHCARAAIDGEKATGLFYLRGPYAMTIGRPLYCEGEPTDRDRVCRTTERIMADIRSLATQSERRIQSQVDAELETLPNAPLRVARSSP
jgi:1-acyl-sn-glycerol-3-phosphate acyltransferase